MSRFLPFFALPIVFLGSIALAQDTDHDPPDDALKGFFVDNTKDLRSDDEIEAALTTMDVEQRQQLNSVCDTPNEKRSHALKELCGWIGQHR